MILPFLLGALSGAAFVIGASGLVLAIAARRFFREQDRSDAVLSKGAVDLHYGIDS